MKSLSSVAYRPDLIIWPLVSAPLHEGFMVAVRIGFILTIKPDVRSSADPREGLLMIFDHSISAAISSSSHSRSREIQSTTL
jgi:hypothetical protein